VEKQLHLTSHQAFGMHKHHSCIATPLLHSIRSLTLIQATPLHKMHSSLKHHSTLQLHSRRHARGPSTHHLHIIIMDTPTQIAHP
jgi:hypothetical protein